MNDNVVDTILEESPETISSSTEFNFMEIINSLVLGLTVVLALWMIYDSIQRYRNKYIFPLIVLIVGFAPFGLALYRNDPHPHYWLSSVVLLWVLYLFVRPEYTREEMKMVEAEQKIKDITRKYYERELLCHDPFCPVCGLPIKEDYIICPNCYKELKNPCQRCGKLIDKNWALCPYCKSKQNRGSADELKDI